MIVAPDNIRGLAVVKIFTDSQTADAVELDQTTLANFINLVGLIITFSESLFVQSIASDDVLKKNSITDQFRSPK